MEYAQSVLNNSKPVLVEQKTEVKVTKKGVKNFTGHSGKSVGQKIKPSNYFATLQ